MGNVQIIFKRKILMKISLKASLTYPNLTFLKLTWSTINAEGVGVRMYIQITSLYIITLSSVPKK